MGEPKSKGNEAVKLMTGNCCVLSLKPSSALKKKKREKEKAIALFFSFQAQFCYHKMRVLSMTLFYPSPLNTFYKLLIPVMTVLFVL